jgi:hypothetical protein
LLARLQPATGRRVGAWVSQSAWLDRRDMAVAVGVGRACVERLDEDMVH